ncbi:MAG: hypothetical protein ACW98D_08170 [Promethearchaeota archaeon]
MIYFSAIALQILRRNRQRLSIILSSFFVCIIIAGILNIIYVGIGDVIIVLSLYFLTIFLLCFGPIFLFIVNMIILESTIIFPQKKQNRYILLYGIVAFLGMLLILIFFQSVSFHKGYPTWNLIFFIYVVSISAIFAVIPFIRTSFKIYFNFETKALKKKWLYYVIGSIGAISIGYVLFINNLLDDPNFRLFATIYGPSDIFWGYLIYYGIGIKLKK